MLLKQKILHITNWYPNERKPYAGVFIKEHIQSVAPFFENHIIHLQCVRSSKFFRIHRESHGANHQAYIFSSFFYSSNRLCVYTLFWVQLYLFSIKGVLKQVDILNYHVAPTLCVYLKFFKRYCIKKRKLVVLEHYSAYRSNFGLEVKSPRLHHIRKIFKNEFQLITVSNQLQNDIASFCGFKLDHLSPIVLPNVVDTGVFNAKALDSFRRQDEIQFTMCANWSGVKDPFPIIKAMAEIENDKVELVIIGDGEYLPGMKKLTEELSISNRVRFCGRLSKEKIAIEMKRSQVFIHSSEYETFSVVCAEALCCGCFLMASPLKAIGEYLESGDGVFVREGEWSKFMKREIEDSVEKSVRRSQKYTSKFSLDSIGEKYKQILGG